MSRFVPSLKRVFFVLFLTIPFLAGCPGTGLAQASQTPTLTVGSKSIQEGILLGKLMVGALQRQGFNVIDRTNMGKTADLRKALASGTIDLYPEYTGTAGLFFPEVASSVWKDSQSGYETAKRLDAEKNGIVWLTPAPAENTWVIAVTRDLANQGITDLLKFASLIGSGGKVTLASIRELIVRSDGLPAFAEAYHFTLGESQLLALDQPMSSGQPASPTRDFNALLTLGTSAQIAGWDMVVLEDPLKVPMIFRPTPITRLDVVTAHGKAIAEALEPLFASLDLATLVRLNIRVVIGKVSPDVVAKEYLDEMNTLAGPTARPNSN